MTVVLRKEQSGHLSFGITGVASAANAGQGSIANTFGVSLSILEAWIVPITESTGSADLSVGVTTAAAAATDVLNADDMNGVTEGKPINCFAQDPGAKTVLVPAVWTTALYLTFTASATLVGFTGILYLRILRYSAEVAPSS